MADFRDSETAAHHPSRRAIAIRCQGTDVGQAETHRRVPWRSQLETDGKQCHRPERHQSQSRQSQG